MCLKVRGSLELNTARWLKLHPGDSGTALLGPKKPNEQRGCFNQVQRNLDSLRQRRLARMNACEEKDVRQFHILDDLYR